MAQVRGKGSIVQLERDKPRGKCRRWQLRVNVGKDPATGRYQTRTRRVTGTWTEANGALRSFISEIEREDDPRPRTRETCTVEEYAERYLEMRSSMKEVERSTLKSARSELKVVCDHIGGVSMRDVTPQMVSDMYVDILQGGTRSGKPAKSSYIRKVHATFSTMFKRAAEEGLVEGNPCRGIRMPKRESANKKAMTAEQAHEFIESLDPSDPGECAYLLAVTMGLRRGEVCGLSWSDVDFEKRTVNVFHSCDIFGDLKETKTKAGMRVLPLPDKTAEALKVQKVAQRRRFERANARPDRKGKPRLVQGPETPVIVSHYFTRVSPTALGQWWDGDRGHFGLSDYTFHELRHTYLTLLAERGVHPKVMQQLAGHASFQITMEIYTHVHMGAKRDAVDAVSELF